MDMIKSELTVAQKLKAIRQKRGFTQEKLGELSGINAGNIRKYESGTISNPTYKTLEKLANALDVPVPFFISGGSSPGEVNEWDEKVRQFLKAEATTKHIKSTWEQIRDNDQKREELIIEVLKTHNYKLEEKDIHWLTVTDHQGFSFYVDKDDFQEMVQRCDKDIRYNIEKLLDESEEIKK
ncbi:putative transcriptional regulator [Clostridium sp. ASBs410]|nr:putative transcriptional regulator [Clostridium sp. ASBs410]